MRINQSFIIIPVVIFLLVPALLSGQFLSNLNASKSDALFTTYAAPQSRSFYTTDQGYQFSWNDADNAPEFISQNGVNFGLAFLQGNELRWRLNELYREPVVTVSYSDLVSYYYYPYRNIRVEVLFDVYSSQEAIADIKVKNEGNFPEKINVAPYLYFPSSDTINNIVHESSQDFYSFPFKKNRDSWMKEHSIPLTEELNGSMASDIRFDSVLTFVNNKDQSFKINSHDLLQKLKDQLHKNRRNEKAVKGLICNRGFRIYPGDQVHFRMVFGLEKATIRMPDLARKIQPLYNLDLKDLIRNDEKAYDKIPFVKVNNRDLTCLYWSCFSLLRQCMMPPEGKCKDNYYVFSREPKWGWGYGGEVFHESLSMLAYAYMDPESAMNSQRVYFDRQLPDGYINYRTGPYLDEIIEYKGKLTTSAPFFHDKKFLEEAYKSGEKFYRYFIANRDSNSNGLCEWSGEASLESLRDARVAVWDNVGWPSNFEGPDVNSMLVKEAKSLSEMANLLGNHEEAKKWLADAESRAILINKYMWDDGTGFYYNVNTKDQSFSYKHLNDLKIKEIIGFLPLWAGMTDTIKTKRLVATMTNPAEFWRAYGVPTLSAQDKYYNPMGYWNGPVWVQWDYLLFRGLMDHGYRKEAEELALKVLDNMIWHLKQDHTFWEFYSPDDREAGWHQTYIWAGLAARFLIDLEK